MSEITKIDTVQQYCDLFGIEALHPLISIVDCDKMQPIRHGRRLYNLYAVLLKDTECGTMSYGKSIYDYEKGTVLFAAPGQVMGAEDDGLLHQPAGWALVFHPELLRGTPLAKMMKGYSYFSYNANEALHLSEQERRTVIECVEKIQTELQHPIDKHSKSLIVDNLKLLLDYCVRFYDRQFITRENANHDILSRFENLLDEYFNSDKLAQDGIPSVQYCADKLCLSANYLGDLLKRETGLSALKHIQQKMLDVAKERVFNTQKSISEISYELGFPYPQHFSRWFKKMAGCTPNEYRTAN
ncbi:helix-turn-helix domain-containing protein [Parabacteroides hominis]|uniref:Helix-turn-helix domain-containing protein n=1 Tax=Parabacteroides hominis TaxID=2763057 RepID=A0ABR7DQT6_9BACT|nr:helix-turn-helix domain-containing protein [Parabacteroides hominis]MBC5633791.1 helix-turn-helix domain-containing protein [Parabacteroides hominis]